MKMSIYSLKDVYTFCKIKQQHVNKKVTFNKSVKCLGIEYGKISYSVAIACRDSSCACL